MRIVLVSTFYYPQLRGGAEHTLHNHAEALARRGFEVSVLSFTEGKKPERFRHNDVDCHALPVPNISRCLNAQQRAPASARMLWHLRDLYNPVAGRLLDNELRAIRPDVVHTENLPGWSCAAWTAIHRLGLPHVQMLHDYQFTCPVATRFRGGDNCRSTCAQCFPFAMARKRFSRGVSHVIANSNYTRQLHRTLGFFPNAKLFDVIYGPGPAPFRGVFHVPGNEDIIRIGYLGRLHPTKGLDALLEAFLSAGRDDAVLRIAGRGTNEYEARLREKCRDKPIEIIGHSPASEFLPSIDVLVVPSLWNEPMGRVIIEAASHGVPVIASAVGGIPELVREGKTGWLFDASVPRQLVSLLLQITPQALHTLQPHCREWAKHFSPDLITDRWVGLYEDLVGRATAHSRSSLSSPAHPALSH